MIEYYGRECLIATAIKNRGDWEKIYADVKSKADMGLNEVANYLKTMKCKAVTIIDDDYPAEVRDSCHRPPFVLFYYGDISLLKDRNRMVTVVGSRKPSEYAKKKTREICSGVAKEGYVVVSGLARGIDTIAAEATVGIPGRSIAVLGNGIDIVYPPENQQLRDRIACTGLLLSEYPDNEPPYPEHFPARNRILATLSAGTFVAEAMPHSGTLITTAFALSTNHDVATLPFEAGSEAMNNYLIKNGGALIENTEDLIHFLSCPKPRQG